MRVGRNASTTTEALQQSETEGQEVEDQEKAEQQTYEHSPMSLSIHELAKLNPTKTYRELEKMKE